MSKIFVTGSNTSKGYITGSGYLNNPVRILIKDKDDKAGSYPTKIRMGTKDRPGNLKINYTDNNTIIFGESIIDDFTFKNNLPPDVIATPNSNLWVFTSGLEIRREFSQNSNNYNNGVLIFAGQADSDGRWLRTKQKVKNPTIIFELLQGPYQDQSQLLNLSQGASSDILKIQYSPDGNDPWTDVVIDNNNVSNENFLDNNSYFTPTFKNNILNNIERVRNNNNKRLSCKVKIDMKSFKTDSSFYLRIIQTSVSNIRKNIWGISNIKIISRKENIEYPLLTKQSLRSHFKSVTGSFATPNKYDPIVGVGSALKNVTDVFASFDSFESNITAFKDSQQIDDSGEEFYDFGVSNETYPGFNSPIKSKDFFEIDLSPTSEVDVGIIKEYGSSNDTSGDGNILMTYWNNVEKRWEKIGKSFGQSFNNVSPQTEASLLSFVSSSAIGFGPTLQGIGTGSTTDFSLFGRDTLATINKPTDIFAFPFGPQYHATGSQYILAKDLGITKPFLLEKSELDFQIKHQLPKAFGSYYQAYLEFIVAGNPNPSNIGALANLVNITPTFFILKQSKDVVSKKIKIETGRSLGSLSEIEYDVNIPGYFEIVSGSSEETYVDETRELITYSQPTFSFKYDSYSGNVSREDFFKKGYPTDKFIPVDVGYAQTFALTSYTGSINLKIPTRIVSKYKNINYIRIDDGSLPTGMAVRKEFNDRSCGRMNSQRGVVNNNASFTLGDESVVVDFSATNQPSLVTNPNHLDLDKNSPYIIFPEDKLIFGWQYPMYKNVHNHYPTNSTNGFYKMTLFGKSKLRMYGSTFQNNKEFHEGINQNLTTANVFETIGNEAVLDKFQIAPRGELTGSWVAQYTTPINNSLLTSLQKQFVPFAGNILNTKRFINTSKDRLGQEVYDVISKDLRDSLESEGEFTLIGNLYKNAFNFTLLDISREIKDTSITEELGKLLTQKIVGAAGGQKYTISGRDEKLGLYPKYIFNNSHFGYVSDFIQQGIDTKFVDDPTTQDDDILTSSPITITFVKSRVLDEDIGIKEYERIDPSLIEGTPESEYQSSNLSVDGTANILFADDENTVNRTFKGEEVIIF